MTAFAPRRGSPCGVLFIILLLALFCGHASAKTDPVAARAVVSAEPLPPGQSARIAVEITIDPQYHIQSAKPLDKFLIRTSVKMEPSPGLDAGPPQYPAGEIINGPNTGGADTKVSAYRGTIYLIVPITIAPDAAPGKRTLTFSLRSQACDATQCLDPTTRKIKVEVSIGEPGAPAKPINTEVFAAADRQQFLQPATEPATAPPTTTAQTPATATAPAAEILLMTDAQQIAAIQSRNYKPFNAEKLPLATIMLFALIGGAILNIMPCVLPVIPLKVLSLVQQAHGDRRLAMLHGLIFSAGIITLFLLLAVALKTAGLFYGQQFQSPAFLIAMALFVVALALSMLGVWTLNPPKALYAAEGHAPHTGYLGSFTNGLMATLLATPCSAPYLGAPLAWAFAQPAWLTTLTLGLVGVGMSLPYLLLAMFPALLSKIPRAGRWSDLLKQALGIVMIGVAVYLITLLPNVTMWPWVLMAAVVVALVCWAWGQIPTYNMNPGNIWLIRCVAIIIGSAIGYGLFLFAPRNTVPMPPPAPPTADGQWQTFNVARLDKALAEGRPVVIDWTASWCINCHVLENFVLDTAPVQSAFKNENVLLLKADLSTDNPPATLLRNKLGSESIPVLAIFRPSRPLQPVVLRDNYTKAQIIDEIAKAH